MLKLNLTKYDQKRKRNSLTKKKTYHKYDTEMRKQMILNRSERHELHNHTIRLLRQTKENQDKKIFKLHHCDLV